MDYEKEYKEAVGKIKDLLKEKKKKETTNCLFEGELNDIFPGLAESEDEKIRKGLIAIITDFDSLYLQENYSLSREDALTWLEKQDEKDKFIEKELECIKGYREKAIKRLEELEKQGEQKSIKHNNDSTIDSNLNDYCCKVYNALHKENGGNLSFERLQHLAMDIHKWCKEQHTHAEWSKEDEFHFRSIESTIEYCKKEVAENDEARYLHNEDLNWLKSLKDRAFPTPQQEWSEEDYNEIETIACHLDNINNEGMAEVLRSIRDKYMSLRPYWKPSDEQLDSLYDVLNPCDGFNREVLESLYVQLKKLREK